MQLPKLVQRYKHRPGDDEFAGNQNLKLQSFAVDAATSNLDTRYVSDGVAEAESEKALRSATKAAEAAVSKAMQAAALAGLEFTAPQDMYIEAPRTEKVQQAAI